MAVQRLLVVGVEDSPPSELALRFAIAEAKRRSASVRVVTVDESTPSHQGSPDPVNLSPAAIHGPNPRLRIQRVIARACTELPVPPPIELLVMSGPVAEALVEASRDADLLVVGHRRRSASFSEMTGGSIADHCVRHARCPVAVISTSVDAGPGELDSASI